VNIFFKPPQRARGASSTSPPTACSSSKRQAGVDAGYAADLLIVNAELLAQPADCLVEAAESVSVECADSSPSCPSVN